MPMLSRHAALCLASGALACTGVIPEPLRLGEDLEPGGWLIIDNGIDAPIVLQKLEDQAGVSAFTNERGETITNLDLQLDTSFSVFEIPENHLLLLEDAREARALRAGELTVVAPGERLSRCACPAPIFDQRTRFVPGGTCARAKEEGKTSRWDGTQWLDSSRAARDLLLHHGGEDCAPHARDLLDAPRRGWSQVESSSSFTLPPKAAPYQRMVAIDENSFLVFGDYGMGVVGRDGHASSFVSSDAPTPDARTVRSLHGILPFSDGRVLGAVSREGVGTANQARAYWLARDGEVTPLDAQAIRIGHEGVASFASSVDSRDEHLLHGVGHEVLVGSMSSTQTPGRIDLDAGTLVQWTDVSGPVLVTPGGTWIHDRRNHRCLFLSGPKNESGSAQWAAAGEGQLAGLGPEARLWFPRVDFALATEPLVEGDGWRLSVFALEDSTWSFLTEVRMERSSGCGEGPRGGLFVVSNGSVRGLTDEGVEVDLRGACRKLGALEEARDVLPSGSGPGWLVLDAAGVVWSVRWVEPGEDQE